MIREFLHSRGIKDGKMSLRGGAWRIEVGTKEGVARTLLEMLPFLYKKRREAKAVLDYLSDQITGNDLQKILRAAVRRGDRERLGPFVDLPWNRSDGKKKAREFTGQFSGRNPSIGAEDESEIIRRHQAGESQRAIARSMGLTKGVVARAILRQILGVN